ncbi:MAG: PAS domain S-box protein [Prolixibacteraceae bacterium]|nr:PAS domain S-box protein [Prolixibacteraceae bacterium]
MSAKNEEPDNPGTFNDLSYIKILLIEDFYPDVELILRTLKKDIGTFEYRHLPDHSLLNKHLIEFEPDIILSDYSIPGTNGMEILSFCKELKPDTPLIVVTGAIDEETAVNCMKAGASDYVLKDNLIRLVPAVKNALEKSASVIEKKLAQKSLSEKEKQLSLILSTSPVGIVNVDKNGKIVYANSQAEQIFGIKEGKIKRRSYDDPIWEIVDYNGNPFPKEKLPFSIVKNTLKPVYDIKHAYKKHDGTLTYLSVNANPVFDSNHSFAGIIASVQDISANIKAEKEVVLSETKYRDLFENMIEGFAYHKIITDTNGIPVDYEFIEVNSAFEKLTGLKRVELIGKTVKNILPNTEDYWIKRYGEVALTGQPAQFINYSKEIAKYFEVSAFSPQYGYFVTAFNDVTKRIEYENELKEYQDKLKGLNTELTLVEEREKRRLAINLHDHFSQLLAISKMKISELINEKDFSKEKGQLSEVREYIEKALTNSRKLTYELSPPVLYELGFIRAIKWHLENESDSHGFEYELNCAFKTVKISDNAQIILYRVFSELITNIIKHAFADFIRVDIEKDDKNLSICVTDNGRGFNVKENLTHTSSFGLFSIKERIEYLDGCFKINSKINKGTSIKITIPLNSNGKV